MENLDESNISQFQPTQEQIQIGINNFKLLFDPNNKMDNELLYSFIDNGCIQYGKLTLQVFIQNTCAKALEDISEHEGTHTIALVCDYFNDFSNLHEQSLLASRIYDVLCCPIPLYENAAFMQCWADLIQQAFNWKELQLECRNNNFDPQDFPFNMPICLEI